LDKPQWKRLLEVKIVLNYNFTKVKKVLKYIKNRKVRLNLKGVRVKRE
jgi:hypothetical protein